MDVNAATASHLGRIVDRHSLGGIAGLSDEQIRLIAEWFRELDYAKPFSAEVVEQMSRELGLQPDLLSELVCVLHSVLLAQHRGSLGEGEVLRALTDGGTPTEAAKVLSRLAGACANRAGGVHRGARLSEHAAAGQDFQPRTSNEVVLLEKQLADAKLPPDLEEWFADFAGGLQTTIEFDSADLFDGTDGFYGDED